MSNAVLDKIVTGIFVVVFGTMWFFSTRYYERPKQYSLIVYDVFGKEYQMDGIRTTFQTQEVANNFVKEYNRTFPHYDFTLASYIPQVKRRTIFDVILKRKQH